MSRQFFFVMAHRSKERQRKSYSVASCMSLPRFTLDCLRQGAEQINENANKSASGRGWQLQKATMRAWQTGGRLKTDHLFRSQIISSLESRKCVLCSKSAATCKWGAFAATRMSAAIQVDSSAVTHWSLVAASYDCGKCKRTGANWHDKRLKSRTHDCKRQLGGVW